MHTFIQLLTYAMQTISLLYLPPNGTIKISIFSNIKARSERLENVSHESTNFDKNSWSSPNARTLNFFILKCHQLKIHQSVTKALCFSSINDVCIYGVEGIVNDLWRSIQKRLYLYWKVRVRGRGGITKKTRKTADSVYGRPLMC